MKKEQEKKKLITSTNDLIEEASNYSKRRVSFTTNERVDNKTSSIASSMIVRVPGHYL